MNKIYYSIQRAVRIVPFLVALNIYFQISNEQIVDLFFTYTALF